MGAVLSKYCIAQNSGGGKLWRIECHSPIFSPAKFICILQNSRLPDKKFARVCVTRNWKCEDVYFEIPPPPEAEARFTQSFK